MKKIIFKKGITVIHIPFLLTDFSPWQEQVRNEVKRLKKNYSFRKDAEIGFRITESGAELTLSITS